MESGRCCSRGESLKLLADQIRLVITVLQHDVGKELMFDNVVELSAYSANHLLVRSSKLSI